MFGFESRLVISNGDFVLNWLARSRKSFEKGAFGI